MYTKLVIKLNVIITATNPLNNLGSVYRMN